MSMRHFVASKTAPSDARQFASDVEYYLTLAPRQLPSRYFYDPLGSALFEAICHLPWYSVTRAEEKLLVKHGTRVLSHLEPLTTLVELGPGSGDKLSLLLESRRSGRHLTLHLVDVSAAALATASYALGAHDNLTIVTHQQTYEAGLEEATRESHRGRTLALFLGSNIGNFDPPGADEFLRTIRSALFPGDALLLGADLVKPEAELLRAYDDPLGVTAAFNRNLLVRINRELRGNFDIDAFGHRAVWDREHSRVEMHLVSHGKQRVRVLDAALDFTLDEGETIWTESSYKYHPSGVLQLLERAGFAPVEHWVEESDGFALMLAQAK
jgi:L-histidine N-alpha-methyltransferase